jgi:hypothetical protein
MAFIVDPLLKRLAAAFVFVRTQAEPDDERGQNRGRADKLAPVSG